MRSTSLEAYQKLLASGQIKGLRKRVCEVLSRSDTPLTDNEVAQPIQGQINSINKRVGELIEMGVLVEMGTKHCTVTGNTVRCTDLTGNDPKPLAKSTPGRVFWIGLGSDGNAVNTSRSALREDMYDGGVIQVREIKPKKKK